jgi:lipoprotein-releasing system permease protein
MTGHDAEGWLEQNANFLSLFDLQERVVAMVIGTVLIVGGFGILAVQIMSVLQKTRDISILRSVGLRRGDILVGFLMQGAVVALSGATLGCLAGWRTVAFLGTLHVKSEGILKSNVFVVYEDPRFYVYGFGFALVTGITASLLPAWRASKVEPVEVLRGQIG